MNKFDVGRFISQLRKEKGLTQKELAEKLNVTDKAVSKWETGKCYPDVETIEKISHLFEVSINELLNGEKILPEKAQKEADKTIIQVMKDTKKEKHKGRIIALILSIITLISGFFAVYQAVKEPESEHFPLQIHSTDKAGILNELYSAIRDKLPTAMYVICTESRIEFDKNDNVTLVDMTLWDSGTYNEIYIKYFLNEETGNPEASLTMFPKDPDFTIDGIHFNKYIKFLCEEDVGALIKRTGNTTDYGYAITSTSVLWETVEEGDNRRILSDNNWFLYTDGEIVPFTNRSQIEGKIYHMPIFVGTGNNTEMKDTLTVCIPR